MDKVPYSQNYGFVRRSNQSILKEIRPDLEWMGKYVDFELGQGPLVPLQCQLDPSLLLRCNRDDGIPFQASRAIDTHLDLRRGK